MKCTGGLTPLFFRARPLCRLDGLVPYCVLQPEVGLPQRQHAFEITQHAVVAGVAAQFFGAHGCIFVVGNGQEYGVVFSFLRVSTRVMPYSCSASALSAQQSVTSTEQPKSRNSSTTSITRVLRKSGQFSLKVRPITSTRELAIVRPRLIIIFTNCAAA